MPAGPPALGERFAGRFDLQALLIHSPLGPVFRAYDLDVDQLVALLVLDDAGMAAGAVEQLRHQVRLARRVTHHCIARTYDIGEHQGRHFVTYEYLDGVRLGPWIEAQPSLASILDVAAQLAEGLAAAHAAGVIHSNLAPSSVMIEGSARAVLGNFGVSRFEAANTIAQATEQADELARGAAYLAPEQVLGQALTSAVDVYALGLLLYEMLVGAPRFGGDRLVVVANAHLDDALADLLDEHSRDPRIPPALAQLLATCLAREPGQRCSAAALAGELRRLLRALTTSDHTPAVAPVTTQRHDSLAVLPFRYRGPAASDYLADALFDELVDLLSQTRGLRVFASGATASFTGAAERDPKQLGEQLGVDVIVDGTILLSGDRLRISARVIEVADGFLLWRERFEGCVADLFDLQDKMAKRIAEALRVELEIIAHRGIVDGEVVESYLRGRQAHLRWRTHGPDGAIAHYSAALERAPDFKPALAHLALATVLAWFQPRAEADGIDWPRAAELAVERAMSVAPELPETRLAAANLAVQHGEFRAAALHLCEALRVAPTFALAHEFIGRLLLETGWAERGSAHLELAVELDPALSYCIADIARSRALHGDRDGFGAQVRRLLAIIEDHRPSTAMVHLRVGAWTHDRELIRVGIELLPPHGPSSEFLRRHGQVLLDPDEDAALEHARVSARAAAINPRLHTLVEQLGAEQAAYRGDLERALEQLVAASELRLVDLEWLERCPLFEPLRERPEFAQARARVRARCEAIWSVVGGG